MNKAEIEKIMKLVEGRLLFPYEGHLVSGTDKTREWTLDRQRTAFNKLQRELLDNAEDIKNKKKSKLFPSRDIRGMLTDGYGAYYPNDNAEDNGGELK